MAIVVPRILYTNRVAASGSTVTASSEATAYPVANLRDQLRSQTWRSATGWTFDAGFNDEVHTDSNDNDRIAHIAPGTYASGSATATAVQTALNAAGVNPRTGLTGLTGWYRADAVTLDSDGLVSAMTDLSGNGNNLSQGTAGSRPQWAADVVDGRPAMYFDGTTKLLASTVTMTSLLGANGVGTIVIVFKQDSDSVASDTLFFAGSGSQFLIYSWEGGTTYRAWAHDTSTKTADKVAGAGVSTMHHGWWYYDQSNLASFVDDADAAAVSVTAMTGALHANIMGSTFKIGTSIKGYVWEVLIFNSGLVENDRRKVAQYLKSRYPTLTDSTTAFSWTVTWGCTYDSTTKKYTISRTGGAGNLTLQTSSAVPTQNKTAAAFKDLGYTITADKTGATTYTGENAAYQSRHWLKVDLGSATALTAAVVLDHNAGASAGTFTQEGNSIDLWLSPTLSQALSGDSAQRSAYFVSSSQRWWRLTIEDVQNTLGYAEVGIWSPWDYYQPPAFANIFTKDFSDLTQRGFGTHGAAWTDERPQHGAWAVLWRCISDSDRTSFETFQAAVPRGAAFLFLFDTADPTGIRYVEHPEALKIELVPTATANLWTVTLPLLESLA